MTRLDMLLEAAVAAASALDSALHNPDEAKPLPGDGETREECEAARAALGAAMAEYSYANCDGCGALTHSADMLPRRLSDASVVPTCRMCLDMIDILNRVLPEHYLT